jgi:AcrR family transcriptional regulator
MESICHETFAKLIQRLTKILEQPGDPIDRLKRGLLAYAEFGLENPHHYRSTFMTTLPDEFDHEKFVKPESPGIQAFDFLRRCVYDCIAAGKFKTMDAELASQTLWAGAHGITSLLITHTHFPWVGKEQVIRGMIDTLVAGLFEVRRS